MSHKRSNQLTVSGERAKHLRPWHRRAFWKGERHAAQVLVRAELSQAAWEPRVPQAGYDAFSSRLKK
jgi:hypothetical protein